MDSMGKESDNKFNLKQLMFIIRQLGYRDIKHGNASMGLGRLWNILNPFINMIIMALVFSKIFHSDMPNRPLYILSGTTIYGLFSGGTTSCLNALSGNKRFLITTRIPRNIFVIEKVYVALVNFLYSMIGYTILACVMRIKFSPTFFLVPIGIILMLIIVLGVGKILAVLNVYFADISHFYRIFTLLLFYASALFYTADRMSPAMQTVLSLNPVYLTISIMRICVLDGQVPGAGVWIRLIFYAVGFYILGTVVFNKGSQDVVAKL